ncbi:unnamed protein product, partial [Aphanomyces euteiches]
MIAILQACEEADKAKEEEAKAKEEAVKAEEEAAKAKEEAAKKCQEIPTTQEDCSWDDLDDPHFCCQSRSNFSRVLDQLKQIHVDFGSCAGVADHLHIERKAAIYAFNGKMIAILQACEEEAKAKEEAVKAEEEAAKAKEEAAKKCQEIPTTREDCSWDDLDDPHFCCQSRSNFSRVLDQLKQIHVDFGSCAGVADHLHEEPTPSQEDVQPPVTHIKTTPKTIARAAKRTQDEAGDPRATKKRRICRHVRCSLPSVKRHAMDPTNCVQGQGRENSPPEFHNDTEDKTAVETTEENGDITPTNCVQGQGRDPHEMKRQPICRRVRFSTVTIISFPSELGECSLPSVGGFPLGMTQQHSDAATFNLETFTDDARPCVSKIPPRERKSRLVAAGVTEKDIKAYDAAVAVIHGSRWSEVKRATERNTMLHEAKCWNSILRQRRQDASWEFKQRDYDRDMTKKRRAMDDEADVSCAQRRKNDHHTTATSARSDVETEVPQWIEHEKHKFRLEMLAQAKQYNIMAHFQRQSLKTSQGQPHGAPHISENHTNACSPNIE